MPWMQNSTEKDPVKDLDVGVSSSGPLGASKECEGSYTENPFHYVYLAVKKFFYCCLSVDCSSNLLSIRVNHFNLLSGLAKLLNYT